MQNSQSTIKKVSLEATKATNPGKISMQSAFQKRLTRALPLVAILSIAVPVASFAGFFGDHPRYVHALSDIRYARALIQRPDQANILEDEVNATQELDVATSEIKVAARDDWKPINDHPTVDAHLDHRGRFTEALKVLARAHDDVCKEEDDRKARGLRNRAVNHLDQAMNYVRQAMRDKRFNDK
jgi:hypothetical protein